MRQKKLILILIVVLCALGGLAYWDEWKTGVDEQQEASKNKPLVFKVEDVDEFLYESKTENGFTKVALIKKDGEWRFKNDLQLKANGDTVQNILKTLEDYKYERLLGAVDKSEYGLERPKRSIAFLTDDDKRFTLDIGDNVPVGYSVYFSVNGDTVYSGPQYLLQSTARNEIDFRDRKVVDFDEKALESIIYFAGGEKLVQFERKKSKFGMTFPKKHPIDSAVLEDFIEGIQKMEVKEFDDSPKKDFVQKYFSAKESLKFILDIRDENSLEIELADVDNHFWLRKSDGSFGLIPDHQVRKLVMQVNDFRDKRFLHLEPGQVNKIVLNKRSFERIGGDFYLVEDGKQEKNGKIYNFLMDVVYAKADDMLSRWISGVKSLERSKPTYNIKFKTNDKNAELKAWKSRVSEGSMIVLSSENKNEVYQVQEKVFEALLDL